jgi:hypothetical protein
MQPPPTGKNIDDYLNYFVSALGRSLTEGGCEILRSILLEHRADPKSLFLYVEKKKEALAIPNPELEEVITNFYWLFC